MSKELEALTIINLYGDEIDGEKVNITYQEYLKAHTIIEQALKRNELMKVLQSGINHCPNCGERLYDDTEQNYCDVCGQKLDWSDEK